MTKELIVPFHEEGIRLIIADDGTEYVPLKPICERLGLDWARQRRNLTTGIGKGGVSTGTPFGRWGVYFMVGTSAGGEQEMTCIPRVRLGGWLYSINPAKVKPEAKEALIRYQHELDLVIDAYLTGNHSAEVKTLRRQVKALKAFCLAFNPLWAKIAALQEAGTASWACRFYVKRSRDETRDAIAAMEDMGVIAAEGWSEKQPDDEQGDLLAGAA